MSEQAQQSKGDKDDWMTPGRVLDPILEHDRIDTDPCADDERQFADLNFTESDNGLVQAWNGVVFANPPFSQKKDWAEEMAIRYNAGRIERGYLLLPDGTDVKSVWHTYIEPFATITWFPYGRVKYLDANGEQQGSPSFGSALSVFGYPPRELVDAFNENGDVVFRPRNFEGQTLADYIE